MAMRRREAFLLERIKRNLQAKYESINTPAPIDALPSVAEVDPSPSVKDQMAHEVTGKMDKILNLMTSLISQTQYVEEPPQASPVKKLRPT
ncbi:hypothetical protein ACLB2K_022490 [Fragaria x ananassa]